MAGRAPRPLRLATRGSPLALAQARLVGEVLVGVGASSVELVIVRTEGDRRADVALEVIGGQGVFVKEVQQAVLEGRADAAVHSAKDLPPRTPEGLELAAVPERADPRDALVGVALGALASGAVVATGSPRRRAQLANLRPDLVFVSLRGNMAARLGHAFDGTADAVVVAAAALDRLGWSDGPVDRLPVAACLPQVGQGTLAVECRADDADTAALLHSIDDEALHRALDAERAFLAALGAGCMVPAAAFAEPVHDDGPLRLTAMMASGDGHVVVRATLEGEDAGRLGGELARRLVVGRGASTFEGMEALAVPAAPPVPAAHAMPAAQEVPAAQAVQAGP